MSKVRTRWLWGSHGFLITVVAILGVNLLCVDRIEVLERNNMLAAEWDRDALKADYHEPSTFRIDQMDINDVGYKDLYINPSYVLKLERSSPNDVKVTRTETGYSMVFK